MERTRTGSKESHASLYPTIASLSVCLDKCLLSTDETTPERDTEIPSTDGDKLKTLCPYYYYR